MSDGAPHRFGRLLTVSPALQETLTRLEAAAKSDAPIVIQGETGTGKELAAEAIHRASARAAGPYLVVDCAAIPEGLIETELFGHVKGAFTGAESDRAGAFEAAHGGTLFIDEIGELPLSLQPRLLRAVEAREVKRVGASSRTAADVRVISATNRDLSREIREGRFREDLYFRLCGVTEHLPALRERPEDVLFLAERFLRELGRDAVDIGSAVRARLVAHPWPGNVRELRNVIVRAAALSDESLRLPEDFGARVEDGRARRTGSVGRRAGAAEPPIGPGEASRGLTEPLWRGRLYHQAREAVLADFERGYVAELLAAHGGNVSKAARAAGLHRNVFARLMARSGLTRR